MQYYSIGKLFRMHSFVDHIVSHIVNIMNRTVTTLRGNQDVEYIEHNIEAKISVCTEQNGAPWVSHPLTLSWATEQYCAAGAILKPFVYLNH